VGKYSTYGMAGVGIAAAIGFVFALTILNTNNPVGTGIDNNNPEVAQRLVETQPNAASSFLFAQQESATSNESAGSSAMAKQDGDQAAGSALSQEAPSTLMQLEATENLQPTLTSVVAVNGTTGDVIAELASDSEFLVGKPYFVQAQFTNPNETIILDHTLIMTLTRNGTGADSAQQSSDSQQLVQATNFHGDIGANETVDLEFYWNPDIEGQYTLSIFSLTPADLSVDGAREPVLSIPVQTIR
jgi:hypothetical protein